MTQTSGYVIANDGVRLHYDEAGAGKAVVLIHGGGLSNVWWERNLPALSRRFHVIAPDTRGCGRSQRTPGATAPPATRPTYARSSTRWDCTT